ncbi:MAG TPA: hypothetical protein DCO79_06405, partial [Spirochaeta sp.]|nr:hypothetical protein [Spirochaeta sp.]
CFGNTLPHLPGNELVKEFFTQAAIVLAPGGRLIFQLINFSRLKARDSFDFPDIKTENTLFKRSYARRSDGRLDFHISLTSLTNGEIQSDSTPLLPLTRADLHDLLTETGFGEIKVYTGYDRESADGSEFASIYSASLIVDI